MENWEQRVENLETRAAFQERLLEELNGVLARYQRDNEDLSIRLRALEEQIRPLLASERLAEKPPHY